MAQSPMPRGGSHVDLPENRIKPALIAFVAAIAGVRC